MFHLLIFSRIFQSSVAFKICLYIFHGSSLLIPDVVVFDKSCAFLRQFITATSYFRFAAISTKGTETVSRTTLVTIKIIKTIKTYFSSSLPLKIGLPKKIMTLKVFQGRNLTKEIYFNCPIVDLPFICSNIPARHANGVYLSVDGRFQSLLLISGYLLRTIAETGKVV